MQRGNTTYVHKMGFGVPVSNAVSVLLHIHVQNGDQFPY